MGEPEDTSFLPECGCRSIVRKCYQELFPKNVNIAPLPPEIYQLYGNLYANCSLLTLIIMIAVYKLGLSSMLHHNCCTQNMMISD